MKERKKQKMQTVRVTPEALVALKGLPSYISRPKFLYEHRLLKSADSVNWTVTLHYPHHNVHVRSIRIINLCNAYLEYTAKLYRIKFDEL